MTSFLKFMASTGLVLGLFATPAAAITQDYRALSQSLLSQAQAALAEEETEKASELVNLALTADPSSAQAFVVKARVQAKTGDAEEALRLVTIGLDIEPANLSALVFQAELAVEVKRFEQADLALTHYVKICGNACDAADNLAALIEAQRSDSADDKDETQKD
ncbi:hypothetical protein N9P30_02405 [Alphaproteobacteria bacterium]|nr:hypothetical protein [Alphaproteobacteria bacterium]